MKQTSELYCLSMKSLTDKYGIRDKTNDILTTDITESTSGILQK